MKEEKREKRSEQVSEDDHELQLVTFRLQEEEFAVEIGQVREILRMTEIVPVPRTPPYFQGITNLRGSILPVINSARRLNLPDKGFDQENEILVIAYGGQFTGIIVNEVQEVIAVKSSQISEPNQVIRGIDRFFLKGVVRIDGGRRIILLLNLDEFLHIESGKSTQLSTIRQEGASVVQKQRVTDYEQFVTFYLGNEEFAFKIDVVREILRVGEITPVPNVPSFVLGIQTVRDAILPIIDMRRIVNLTDGLSEFRQKIELIFNRFKQTYENLCNGMLNNPGRREFIWNQNFLKEQFNQNQIFNLLSPRIRSNLLQKELEINSLLSKIVIAEEIDSSSTLWQSYEQVYNQLEKDLQLAASFWEKRFSETQKILIVDIAGEFYGFLVDRVNQVMQVESESIERTATVLQIYGKELQGIAKLQNGERIIMLLDEKNLLTIQEKEVLQQIQKESSELAKKEVEAVQKKEMIVFSIFGEEFAVDIDRVKEIFRIKNLTPVPRASDFIRGLTNLRGNIIPVIDIRRRFNLDDCLKSFRHYLSEVERRFRQFLDLFEKNLTAGNLDQIRAQLISGDTENYLQSVGNLSENLRTKWERVIKAHQGIILNLQKMRQKAKKDIQAARNYYLRVQNEDIRSFLALLKELQVESDQSLLQNEKILVVNIKDLIVGLLVDNVREVLNVEVNAIEPAPLLVSANIEAAYLDGIVKINGGERMILFLNVDEIMSKKHFQELKKLTQEQGAEETESVLADSVIRKKKMKLIE